MQTTTQNNNLSLQQLAIAEHIKKQALAVKWNQFAQIMPSVEPDISEQEIMDEIKAVRAERFEKATVPVV